jgi:hypothetical protein
MKIAGLNAKPKYILAIDSELVVRMKDERVYNIYCSWNSYWNF